MVGTLILALDAGVGTVGQRTVASGVVGVLSAMIPVLAACLGYALFREKPARRALFGLAIGFAGIGLLLRPGSALDPLGVSLVRVSLVAWALGAVLAPRMRLPADPRLAAGLELLGGSCALLIASATWGEFSQLHLTTAAWHSWLGLGWLVLTAIGGFTAYGFLTQRVTTSISTTFCYVNPVIAVGLGWLLFGEPVTMRMIVATGVVIVGRGGAYTAYGLAVVARRHHHVARHASHRHRRDRLPRLRELRHRPSRSGGDSGGAPRWPGW